MNNRLKIYEQHLLSTLHYRKILQAKTTIALPQSGPQLKRPNRISPLDRYQYNLTNDKIRKKLSQIYQSSPSVQKKKPKKKSKRQKSASVTVHEERESSIDHENINIMRRIMAAESVVGENWKKREKSLRKYSKLTRKKAQPEDCLYQAFKQIERESRGRRGRSLRSNYRSEKKRQKSFRQSASQIIALRQTL